MRIKKFTANNYAEALEQVKQELGDEALIISTRSIKPNTPMASFSSASKVEITAAIEFNESPVATMKEDLRLEDENKVHIKSLIFNLLSEQGQAQSLGLKPNQFETYSLLVENGLDKNLASKLLNKTKENNDENPKKEKLQVINLMKKVIPFEGEINLLSDGPKLVAFVGPTGVGKTTTIAKVAADYAIRKNKKVALVSLDTYRLGAVDQLQIYGDIMRLPVEVASEKQAFCEIINRNRDKDLILIDTTGRSHRDQNHSRHLKEIFAAVGEVEVHLVLSISSQEKLFSPILQQFSPIGVDRVLFTKLDEGLSFGPLFNFSVRNRVPLSYFTIGQNVPEDLEIAAPDKVISLIFN